jgi:transcription initiation factor IIF auxiliary subunit
MNMMNSPVAPSVDLVDTVFEPNTGSKEIHYSKQGDKTLYKVWLQLHGRELPYVRGVTYRLHPTFPNPERFVPRTPANPNCTLPIWTWGLFDVEAEVVGKDGERHTLVHPLQYDRELRKEGIQFKEE